MGLSQLNDILAKCYNAIFGLVAQLTDGVPASLALCCQVELLVDYSQIHSWRCRPSQPRNRWLDDRIPPADLGCAVRPWYWSDTMALAGCVSMMMMMMTMMK